jgi:hypothetical protein
VFLAAHLLERPEILREFHILKGSSTDPLHPDITRTWTSIHSGNLSIARTDCHKTWGCSKN